MHFSRMRTACRLARGVYVLRGICLLGRVCLLMGSLPIEWGLPAPWHCGKADPHVNRQHVWKHYLPTTSFAVGNNRDPSFNDQSDSNPEAKVPLWCWLCYQGKCYHTDEWKIHDFSGGGGRMEALRNWLDREGEAPGTDPPLADENH